jgi:hypothetical protein
MIAERQFENELETFRRDAEAAAQFFYAYLAIHEVAKRHRSVLAFLNKNALWWNTVAGSLQMSALISVHRIFNNRSRHNVDSLLRVAETNSSIFSKQALRQRKQGNAQSEPDWLDAYMRDVYEPTTRDFKRIRAHVTKYKQLYESNYAGLRNKVYAHTVASDPQDVQALVARTSIREMQWMFVFPLKLYETFQQLYDNGRKPVFRPRRYSAARIATSFRQSSGGDVHARIAKEVEQVLLTATGGPTKACRDELNP